jgi:hypothetical protein
MLDLSLGNWWIWYEKVWATVYLIPSDTKVLEIYFFKRHKNTTWWLPFMTKPEFLPEPYMIFRLGKLPLIYAACSCFEFSQALLMSYERFLKLLKSRSHTHHPHMHYSYTGGRCKNIPFHLDPPKNILLLMGVNTKICLLGFPSTK